MNSKELVALWNSISATNKRNEKIKIITEHLNDDVFYMLLVMAFDPLKTYKFKSFKFQRMSTDNISDDPSTIIDVLNNIENFVVHYGGDELRGAINWTMQRLDDDINEIIVSIINNNVVIGVQSAIVNSAIDAYNKNHRENPRRRIFEFACMLCTSEDSVDSERTVNKWISDNGYVYVQQKLDGMRFTAIVNADKQSVQIYGRSGKTINLSNSEIESDIVKLVTNTFKTGMIVIDGELLVDYDKTTKCAAPRQVGNGLLNKGIRGTITAKDKSRVYAVIWDIIDYNTFTGNNGANLTLDQRWALLTTMFERGGDINHVDIVPCSKCDNYDHVLKMFEQMLDLGFEGVIVKNPISVWVNKRSNDQIKYKNQCECDLIITGFDPMINHDDMIGSINAVSSDKIVEVSIGSGLNDEIRQSIHKEQQSYIGRIVTVRYNALITNVDNPSKYSLFLPRFIELREDKDEGDDGLTIATIANDKKAIKQIKSLTKSAK